MRALASALCGAKRRAGQRQAPHHQPHQIELDFGALEEGDLHDAAFERRDFQIAFDIVAAHHVENDVGAVTCRSAPAHGLDEILLVVVDGAVGAERHAGLAFSALPTVDDHAGAEAPGDLDCGGADAARAAMDQQPVRLPSAAPRSNTLFQTVKTVSGSAAASTQRKAFRHGQAWWLRAPRRSRHSRRH